VAVASTVNGKRGGNEFWISYAKAESSSIVWNLVYLISLL
jgi:hypothetical protein